MGKGHGDQQFTPGIGDVKWGKVMATAYAWYWRFKMGKGHGNRLRLVLVI
jgi:hypothetical protein